MKLFDVQREVAIWVMGGREAGAFKNSDRQLLKSLEELGETASAHIKGKRAETIDGVGDIIVTLLTFCVLEGINAELALEYAWNQVKNRKGKWVNGVFIKDAGQDGLPPIAEYDNAVDSLV